MTPRPSPKTPKEPVRLPLIISPSGGTSDIEKQTPFKSLRTPTPRPLLPPIRGENSSSDVQYGAGRPNVTRASGSTRGIISSNVSRGNGSDSNRTIRASQNTHFGGSQSLRERATCTTPHTYPSAAGGGPNNSRQTSFFSAAVMSSSATGGDTSTTAETTSSSSGDVSSSWLDVSRVSYPSFAENDWMSDSEGEDVEQILKMNVITTEDNGEQNWEDTDVKRQLLVEILSIVQFPDFSVDLEDYGIRVKRVASNKGVLAVKITRHKKKEDDEDDKVTGKRRKRKKRKRAWNTRNMVQAKFQKEEKSLVRETRRFQYSVEMSKLLAANADRRKSSKTLRRPLIVALRDLSLIDKQDRADRMLLPDISTGNMTYRGISAMTNRLNGGGRATRQQLSRLSNTHNSIIDQ